MGVRGQAPVPMAPKPRNTWNPPDKSCSCRPSLGHLQKDPGSLQPDEFALGLQPQPGGRRMRRTRTRERESVLERGGQSSACHPEPSGRVGGRVGGRVAGCVAELREILMAPCATPLLFSSSKPVSTVDRPSSGSSAQMMTRLRLAQNVDGMSRLGRPSEAFGWPRLPGPLSPPHFNIQHPRMACRPAQSRGHEGLQPSAAAAANA